MMLYAHRTNYALNVNQMEISAAQTTNITLYQSIKGNILEALQVQKSICAFVQFKVFAQRVVPLFLISCAVSAHREEVNV